MRVVRWLYLSRKTSTQPVIYEWITESYPISLTYQDVEAYKSSDIIPQSYEFFRFWYDRGVARAGLNIFSVRDGALTRRRRKIYLHEKLVESRIKGVVRRGEVPFDEVLPDEEKLLERARYMIEVGGYEYSKGRIAPNYKTYQSPRWWSNAIVVQDPFVMTHTHTEFVTREILEFFDTHAKRTTQTFERRGRLTSIFGPHVSISEAAWAQRQVRKGERLAAAGRSLHTSARSRRSLDPPEFAPPPVPQEVLQKRAATIERIKHLIQNKYGAQYKIEMFGSTCYGSDSPHSDLDLVIVDPHRPHGIRPDDRSLPPVYDIHRLSYRIRTQFAKVEPVAKAVVPIVKFKDLRTGLSCDLNVNDRLGIVNTALIKRYCELAPVLPTMLFALKSWARPLGLNDPSGSQLRRGVTFSSYALALMTIGRLQMLGLLPNLQYRSGRQASNPKNNGVYWFRRKDRAAKAFEYILCNTAYATGDDWIPTVVDVREALIDWFRYWADQHLYSENAMSVLHGGALPRRKVMLDDYLPVGISEIPMGNDPLDSSKKSRQATQWSDTSLCIGDPFISRKNLTANISGLVLENFRTQCRMACSLLQDGSSLEMLFRRLKRQTQSP
ncbi:uncharacterized protein FIBRA_06526 [Fibroporia radiculosa]|uniref:Poly(A) RNA polymerase mitochondrial-like central palm domain-containing protein n=1 Tax=Fibroporia radiculosa TaxID=599839 RepID=J4H445_9APHY|nr:uncharacterized protein FIBRA_06526 [Fibroporia radiculosa]CCM04354.1 predicted protein [Fibroporia radiculosa]